MSTPLRWQRARITRPDFEPVSDVGRLIWVEAKPPEHARIHGEIVHTNGIPQRTDYDVEADWYWTNQTFQRMRLRIAHSDVELLPYFTDWTDTEAIEDRT